MHRIALLIGMAFSLVSAQIHFSENFEGSTTNWTVSGGGWQFGTPTVGPSGAFEGNKCAGTVLNGNYSNYADYVLTSPSIKLPNISLIRLSFYDWYSTESSCDYLYLEIEVNNSGTWTQLRSRISGSSTYWKINNIDLSQYADSTVRIRFRLTTDGSITSYGWYIDQLNISTPEYKILTVQISGNGTTSPAAGITQVETGVSTSITATPSTGYRFNNWTIVGGTAMIASPSSQSTNVTLSTDATIRANFIAGTVYPITSTAATYNFTTHYYDIQPSNGVRFSFTAQQAGNYSIVVSNSGSVGKYIYYFGTSGFSSSYVNYVSGSGTTTYNFSAAAAGEVHYFRVSPSSSSYYTSDFAISYSNAYLLTLISDSNGTVSPSSAILTTGQTQTITATPNTGYRFKSWTLQSGNATISDTNSASTTVSITNNATIRANFIAGTVYPITSTAATYNFTTHYYDIQPSNGVRFSFTAQQAGNYSIVVSNSGSVGKYIYYFGTSGFSSSYVNYVSGSGTTTYNFSAAAAGEVHYFRVSPSSSSYYTSDFAISYSNAYLLTLISDSNGTVSPSSAILTTGQTQTITATPNTGYRFKSWTLQSGNATISDTNSASTTVSITRDATIKANFIPGTVYPVTLSPTIFNFTTHYYEKSPSFGVRLKFIAPAPGTYAITLDSAYKNLTYYGNDSTFTSASGTLSYTTAKIIYSFRATTSNESHYFLIRPYSSSYYLSNFTAQIITPVKLKIIANGKGSCFPSDLILCWKEVDTTITAIPNGGYMFSSWNLISGNVQFSSTSSAITRVRVSSDSAVIEANIVINPATKPNISISDINISSYPDICLTTVVTDSAGRSISGLDTTNFSLMQDSINVSYQLTQVSEVAGISVALVIDRSGSMSNQMMNDAKNAALQYVRTMGPLDRSAIITFSNTPQVEQAITSDTLSLISAINRIVTYDMTALLDGTLEGLKQLQNETNTRAVIVFSDGVENYSSSSQSTVIDYARQNNITIYSIGIGSSADRTVLQALADSTGGYFTAAPSAAQLAQIYAQIKSDIQSQYILCYRSPDQVFNGDTHQVIVSVNLNNHTDRDTVYWNENNRSPVISLTAATQAMLTASQQPNQSLIISANVTDDGTISSVRLFYRPSNLTSGAYTEVAMQNSSGSLYQATIPATSVNYPGIDFYILATDNYQLIGRSPNILAPETQPWVIPVGNNIPTISNIQAVCLNMGNDNTISANIDDDGGINLALLYYKKRNETFFAIDTMTEATAGVYSGTIPSNMTTSNGIDYYIRAVDDVGAAARYPSSSSDSLFLCTNDNYPPVANAGTDSDVYLSSGCNATVNLNGSASTDPDGDPISFKWTGPFSDTLTGATPSVNLPTGQFTIALKVTDNSGLFDLDTVLITVRDTTSPVFSFIPADTVILIRANDSTSLVSTDSARARDNCTVNSISAIRSDKLPLGSVFKAGLTTITWVATDLSGNSDTAIQNITINRNRLPVITVPADTALSEGETLKLTVSISDPDNQKIKISLLNAPAWLSIDSISVNVYTITLSPGCNDHGTTQIHLISTDAIDTAHAYFNVRIDDVNFPPTFVSLPFEDTIDEGVPYELTVTVQDCDDDTIPFIRMLTSVAGVTFTDNRNSTGVLRWTPDADDYGYYMYIFETTDGVNAPVRDTIIIEVIDHNISRPVLAVSTVDTISSVNLPLVIVARATDADGTIPILKGIQLPEGANFTRDNNGNAVFSWTPRNTGTFTFKIIACDYADSLSYDSQTVTIKINNNNITGPIFDSHDDVTIQQNENLILNLRATDPDGTIPILRLLSAPSGSRLIDNGNGTATVSWSPACDISGTFLFRATASDGEFHDTITISVQVRDVNCTPVFIKAEDVNAQPGERISMRIRAYDPDNNGSIPTLSVQCMLPDYSFVTQNNGSAIFNWTVSYTQGSYPVTFYATDGNSTDSMKVMISINKAGTLKITAYPSGCRIYAFPSDCYKGKLIGVDSTVYYGTPGTCWFEFQAPGYRSQRIAYNIKPDTTTTLSVKLQPAIPLMVLSPDTLKCGSSSSIVNNGSISFADLNRDHIFDLSIATTSGIICYYGTDSTDNSLFSSVADTIFTGTLEPSLHHTFTHWNNNTNLSCILSTKTGKVLRINLKTKTVDTLISISGSRFYPTIFDADGDNKKDLIVVNAGKGLFVYLNTGSDSVPAIAFARQSTTPDGLPLTGLNGAALLLDTDMDGKEEVIAFSEGKLKLFRPDSGFSTLTCIENLSCGGKLVTADSMSSSLIGSTKGISSFAIRNGNHILVYPTHLQGDITLDRKVDIRDISKASRNWEMTPDDPAWDPSINVKLSDNETEVIDIRDVSRISKNWELQQ